MDPTAKRLFDYLSDVIHGSEQAPLDVDALPPDFRELGLGLQYYVHCVRETNDLARSLANGELNVKLPPTDNPLAAPLKALHATLRHMTWQTQQVAKGDYQQRMEFMGDFSTAFNTMVEQLRRQRGALLAELESSHKKVSSLVQSNKLLVSITGQILQWIVVVDRQTMEWLFVSREADEALHDPATYPALLRWMAGKARSLEGADDSSEDELALPGRYGTQYFSVTAYPLHWQEHNALAFVFTDVSGEKERLDRLQEAAWYDNLTKVYNRFYGMELLERWLGEREEFVLCFVDMDSLKQVNDLFGHGEGDRYIQAVAAALREFSPDAAVCRFGGDEFLLLDKGWTQEAAENRMEELRLKLHNGGIREGLAYSRCMSCGVVAVDALCGLTAEQLLALADQRMYGNKRCGYDAGTPAREDARTPSEALPQKRDA